MLFFIPFLLLCNLVASLTLSPIARDDNVSSASKVASPQCKTSVDCANRYYCRRGGCVKIPKWPPQVPRFDEEDPNEGDISRAPISQPEITPREIILCKKASDCQGGLICVHGVCAAPWPPRHMDEVPEVEDDVPREESDKSVVEPRHSNYCAHEICVPVGANESPRPDNKCHTNRDPPKAHMCRDHKCHRFRREPPRPSVGDTDVEEEANTNNNTAPVEAPPELASRQSGNVGEDDEVNDNGVESIQCKSVSDCPRHFRCLNGNCLPIHRPPPELLARDTVDEKLSDIDEDDEEGDETQELEPIKPCRQT
ncbi:hypothetical protein BBP40_007649 [Aspergillus hancockii]|nr:hypothetical protein BBP40_007649 [Aspergillus hancockii]